jgi:uncharacterized protein (TIGR02453 family)
MKFSGWPVEAVEFYQGLEADNSKTYWTAHKAVYDASVHAPMAALLAELADEFGAAHIFRPYRDVRFRADKSPYKLAIYATLASGGYVGFKAAGLTAGRGYHRMESDQLARYRQAVADDGPGTELTAIVAGLTKAQLNVAGGESLKTAPKGYPKDHPRIDLLRHKGLFTWREWPVGAWLGTAAAKKRVVDVLRLAEPLQVWLDDRVGPSQLEPTGTTDL